MISSSLGSVLARLVTSPATLERLRAAFADRRPNPGMPKIKNYNSITGFHHQAHVLGCDARFVKFLEKFAALKILDANVAAAQQAGFKQNCPTAEATCIRSTADILPASGHNPGGRACGIHNEEVLAFNPGQARTAGTTWKHPAATWKGRAYELLLFRKYLGARTQLSVRVKYGKAGKELSPFFLPSSYIVSRRECT